MDNVIVYVGSGFNPTEFQKIMDTLRRRNIMVTADRACATLVLLPDDSMDVDTLLQKHLPTPGHIFRIMQHVEVTIPTPKPKKQTFINPNSTNLYNSRQNHKQRFLFLTRTQCK